MKYKAFILLLNMLAYIGGWIVVPGGMCMPPPKNSCCEETMKNAGHPGCPKPEKENNAAMNCCMNCPLSYIAILPVNITESLPSSRLKKLYFAFTEQYAYRFYADTWKPPGRA